VVQRVRSQLRRRWQTHIHPLSPAVRASVMLCCGSITVHTGHLPSDLLRGVCIVDGTPELLHPSAPLTSLAVTTLALWNACFSPFHSRLASLLLLASRTLGSASLPAPHPMAPLIGLYPEDELASLQVTVQMSDAGNRRLLQQQARRPPVMRTPATGRTDPKPPWMLSHHGQASDSQVSGDCLPVPVYSLATVCRCSDSCASQKVRMVHLQTCLLHVSPLGPLP